MVFGVCGGLAENLPDHICSAYFCVHMCLLCIFSMYLIIAFGDIKNISDSEQEPFAFSWRFCFRVREAALNVLNWLEFLPLVALEQMGSSRVLVEAFTWFEAHFVKSWSRVGLACHVNIQEGE